MPEIERQRLLENHLVHALAELRAQQRLAGRESALRRGHRGDEYGLEHHVAEHRSEIGGARTAARGQGSHHRIDDLRAHPGDPGGQDSREEREQREGDREPPARRPDKVQGVPGVLKGLRQRPQHRETACTGRSGSGAGRIEAAAGDH
jgi:hypothetical protein